MKPITRHLSASLAIVLALALTSLSRPATAQTSEYNAEEAYGTRQANVPPGHHVERHSRRGWVLAGSIVMGALYGLGVASSSNQDSSSPSKWLYLPVLGPWIALGALGSYDEAACDRQVSEGKICPSKGGAKSAYTILGVGQLAGLGMIVGGVLVKTTEIVPDAVAKHDINLVPLYAGNTPAGMSVSGRF
jgi:hypothetical protein